MIKQSTLFLTLIMIVTISFSFFILPQIAYSQDQPFEGGGTVGGGTTLENPLGSGNIDPRLIIGSVIKAILGIVGSLALAMIIFGGFMWVIAGGNDEKIKKGKDIITWAALGLLVIFFSYALVNFVINAMVGTAASG